MPTKYEIRDANSVVQFATLEEAQEYNPIAEIFEVEDNTVIITEPTLEEWYNLEQSLFTSALFSKGVASQGNGFALLLKVLTDGSTKGTSQNALLTAIQITLMGIANFTQADRDVLNTYLQTYNFRIRV